MDDMPDWYGRAVRLVLALIAVVICMGGIVAHAQVPRYWWAERMTCLPMSDVPVHERCGLSRIGPWPTQETCEAQGPMAWLIEEEALEKAGWGAVELEDAIRCTYRGPANTVS